MTAQARIERAKPYSPETLAERWGCSEGLIYKLVREGRLQCFRPGSLIRIAADEVERFECQTTASNDCEAVSPPSIASMESGSEDSSPRRIARAPRRKLASSGQGLTLVRGPSDGV